MHWEKGGQPSKRTKPGCFRIEKHPNRGRKNPARKDPGSPVTGKLAEREKGNRSIRENLQDQGIAEGAKKKATGIEWGVENQTRNFAWTIAEAGL